MTKFCIPEGYTYLLNHSVGCLTTAAQEANQAFINSWSEQASLAWPTWIEDLQAFNHALAALFNTKAELFCPTAHVSDALFKLLTSLPESKRRKIVYSELDFPTIGHVLSQMPRLGFELCMIPKSKLIQDPESAYASCIDQDTMAVIVSHSTFGDSRIMPYADIQSHCHNSGAFMILDVAQSAGVIPIDLQQTPVDCMMGCSVKWLCGGPGASFLYASETILSTLRPLAVGWFSNEDIMAFDIQSFQYAQHGRKFLGGTPNALPYKMASASIQTLIDIGIDKINQHNQHLKNIILNTFDTQLTFPATQARGGTVTLNIKHAEDLTSYLEQQHIAVDYRPGFGLRLSPHIYNTEDEIHRVIEALNRGF